MFYCTECQIKYDNPESIRKSYGTCELCGKLSDCNDVPSSRLNKIANDEPVDEVLTSKQSIHSKIKELETHRESILNAATAKADTLAHYRKQKAITILKLRNKMIPSFEGIVISYPLAVTLIPQIAQGICWEECLKRTDADGCYKGLITIMESLKAELNGLQSINKHLE